MSGFKAHDDEPRGKRPVGSARRNAEPTAPVAGSDKARAGKRAVFDGAKLLIAADCTAYAYAAFHEKFIKNHITLVGCPKLDSVDYSEKLTEIIANNNIQSVTVVRMEVPCCGGLEHAAKQHCRTAANSSRGRS